MKKHLLQTLLFVLFGAFAASAQNSIIKGKATDAITGEDLIGASIFVTGTSNGSATGITGEYEIKNLKPGIYSITCSYISYLTKILPNVEVAAGQVLDLNIALEPDQKRLDEVVVEGKADMAAASALTSLQQKSALVQDGIASEQFLRNGDSNAANAVRRVTGVSIEGGKYVYVRGLGDRYSKTALNSAELPGLDPNKNAVQMDLFPSQLIDNIVVVKTFSPELPASFAGGYVNITTKDYPEEFLAKFSTSLGVNTNATFNKNFLTYNKGKRDWLGFDDGTRGIPTAVKDFSNAEDKTPQLTDAASKAFNSNMDVEKKTAFLNHSHAFTIGNKTTLFGKPFGYIAGISYRRDFNNYSNSVVGRFNQTGTVVDNLNPKKLFDDNTSTETVLWGAVANMTYKLSQNHKIGLNLMRNQSGETMASLKQGMFDDAGQVNPNFIMQTRVLQYLQRSLNTAQLRGVHKFDGLNGLAMDWMTSVTRSSQDEPDLRFFTNDYEIKGENKLYQIQSAAYAMPSRYFREMAETNIDNKLNFELPFKISTRDAKLKAGGAFVGKSRTFGEKRYDYVQNNGNEYNGSVSDYLSGSNLGVINGDFNNPMYGVYLRDNSQLSNSYDAHQYITAAYAMGDLPLTDKLRVITGLRFEQTNIGIKSLNPRNPEGKLLTNDFLPALNATYKLQDNMNLRFAYGKTLARPTFRELAPYATFEFVGDYVLVGNPELKRTTIQNFDLRWEKYFKPGELITFSAFYKHFNNPIERVINPSAANLEMQYKNVDRAEVLGLELEVKKSLGFVSPMFEKFNLGGNISLVKSVETVSPKELEAIRAIFPDAKATREMFGQSPFVANLYLGYDNFDKGLTANIAYNVFGRRLSVVGVNVPNVYEQPRHSLDFSFSKDISEKFKLGFQASNLLNAKFNFIHTMGNGNTETYQAYNLGRTFSFSATYSLE